MRADQSVLADRAASGAPTHRFHRPGRPGERQTDARIVTAIDGLERGFLNDYEISRNEVYAAAGSGQYPLDAGEWMRQATRGIDSLLAVAAAVSRVADEEAEATMVAMKKWYAERPDLFITKPHDRPGSDTYPQYEELISEMKAVNAKLVIYANHLKKMIDI